MRRGWPVGLQTPTRPPCRPGGGYLQPKPNVRRRENVMARPMALTATSNPGNPAIAHALRVDYAYNGFGELSSQQVSGPQGPLYREGYPERDQLGRLTKRIVGTDPATAVTHGYGYHPQRGWLSQHKLNDSLADAWSYDVRGNRVGKHIGLAGEVTATVDAQDRLLQLGAEALEYDLNGRVVARSGGQLPATYVWDAFGRLREARLNPSQPTEIAVAYGLDPAGRRVRAVAKDAGGAVLDDRSWVYDGQLRVIAEVSVSGALQARYLYASSGHSPDLAVTFDPDSGVVTGSYLLVHDQVGSVVRTVDLATGVAVESVAYDPWGVATLAPGGTAVHPFGFAGGLWDRRTGLVRFGAREYDAGLGRWLARDPIGFGGGWNHYGYAGGDPVGLVDPDGLNPVLAGWGLVLAQGAATGAAVDTAFQLGEMAFGGRDWGDFDWGRVGVAAGFGAVTGGLMRWFFPPAPPMVCRPPANPNRLRHIFGKPEHLLDDFVRESGGEEAAYYRIQDAANRALEQGKLAVGPEGILPGGNLGNVIDVGGTPIRLIGGKVHEGSVLIGSASRMGL